MHTHTLAHVSTCASSSDGVRHGGVGATIDVLKGLQGQLLRVRQVGNVHGHPGTKKKKKWQE